MSRLEREGPGGAWTTAQRRAIEARHPQLAVAAGAGAGKTAVLVARVLRRVLDDPDPVDIDRLAVVTYTEAAAAELRARLRAELRRRGGPRATRQELLLARAPVGTIHAFCLDLLRRHFHRAGLDPAFRVLDEHEAALLREEALEAVLEAGLAAGPGSPVWRLAELHGAGLAEGVRKLHALARTQPDPPAWLGSLGEADVAGWLAELRAAAAEHLGAAAILAQQVADVAATEGLGAWVPALRRDAAALADLAARAVAASDGAAAESWDQLVGRLGEARLERLPASRGADPAARERLQRLRDRVRDALKEARRVAGAPEAEVRRLAQTDAWVVRSLVALVRDFDTVYRASKERIRALDFADLEHEALRLLRAGAAPRLEEVLVDEYQDVNPVQEAILEAVGAPLTTIGDLRQSIYGFRLADPSRFAARLARPDVCRIALRENFRSRPAVLEAVNFLAAQLPLDPDGGGPAEAGLVAAARFAGPDAPVELHLIEARGGDDETTHREREAAAVARLVRRMVEGGVAGPDGVAVLLRKLAGRGGIYAAALRAAGLPVAGPAGGPAESPEVEEALALLQVLDNPRQDIPLAAVLRSPLAGLTAAELAALRAAHPRGQLWDAVRAAARGSAAVPERLAGDLARRLAALTARVDDWRTEARRSPVGRLLARVYREAGLVDRAAGLPGGERRVAHLEWLLDRARSFDRGARGGLALFLRYVQRVREADAPEGSPPAGGGVQVLSIHRSKGLEWPVVVVAGLGERFGGDDRDDVWVDRELGVGVPGADADARVRYPTPGYRAVRHRSEARARAEEARVLYVAATRARDRLVLVGSAPDLAAAAADWCLAARLSGWRLPPAVTAAARSPLDWVAAAVARHADGAPIRALAGAGEPADGEVAGHASRWSVRVWSAAEAARGPGGPAEAASPPGSVPSGESREAGGGDAAASPVATVWARVRRGQPLPDQEPLDARVLRWRYPHHAVVDRAAKASATELARVFAGVEDAVAVLPPALPRPRFRQARGLTAAEAGAALHVVLRHLDLRRPLDRDSVAAQVAGLVARDVLSPEAATAVDVDALAALFAGPLGRRLAAAADRVERELPFVWRLPLADAPGEWVLVQGVVDCLWEDEGGLWLVDWKSGPLPAGVRDAAAAGAPASPGDHLAAYRAQVGLYARAMEEIRGRPVARASLYFLEAGVEWVVVPPPGGPAAATGAADGASG